MQSRYYNQLSTLEKLIIGIVLLVIVGFGSFMLNYKMNMPDKQVEQPSGENTLEPEYTTAWVNNNVLNFRPTPSTNNTPIRQLKRGDEVKVLEVDSYGWAKVINEYDEEGYVDNDLLGY